MSQPPGVVLGMSGPNPLGVVRSLGKESIPVVGYHIAGTTPPHALHSRHLASGTEISGEEELLERLVADTEHHGGVLFPTGDDYLFFCQENLDILSHHYRAPQVPGHDIRTLARKDMVLDLGRKAGFTVPEHQVLSQELAIPLPVIIKPFDSTTGKKRDMRIVYSTEEYVRAQKELLGVFDEMVVESYIPGDNHFEIHTYQSSEGPVMAVALHKDVLTKIGSVELGSIISSEYHRVEEAIGPALALTRNVASTTPLDINLKQDERSGKFIFLEVNFRTSSNLMLSTQAGVNMPALVYRDRTGQDISQLVAPEYVTGKKWVYETKVASAIEQGQTSSARVRELLREGFVGAFYDPLDPKPAKVAGLPPLEEWLDQFKE